MPLSLEASAIWPDLHDVLASEIGDERAARPA
ncbi:hypothetical protein [Singulisphaera acidiphila]|nr:hypothetical protein [Singulisphaera acidiphila]